MVFDRKGSDDRFARKPRSGKNFLNRRLDIASPDQARGRGSPFFRIDLVKLVR